MIHRMLGLQTGSAFGQSRIPKPAGAVNMFGETRGDTQGSIATGMDRNALAPGQGQYAQRISSADIDGNISSNHADGLQIDPVRSPKSDEKRDTIIHTGIAIDNDRTRHRLTR